MKQRPGDQWPGDQWLVHQWIVAGIVSASARFIPVPFVEDVVRQQCRRVVVARTIAANQTSFTVGDLKPLYADDGGCLSGCLGLIVKAPLTLLLFPIRKLLAIINSVRGIPLEIINVVLLGRTVDRYLKMNSGTAKPEDVSQLRSAFDTAFARMDFRVLQAAIYDTLKSASGWKAAATEKASKLAGKLAGKREMEADALELEANEQVDAEANKIQAVMDRPAILELFADFDRRVDSLVGRAP